jgi:hypothetical protein
VKPSPMPPPDLFDDIEAEQLEALTDDLFVELHEIDAREHSHLIRVESLARIVADYRRPHLVRLHAMGELRRLLFVK